MALPKFVSDDQALMLLQTQWASKLDPLLAIGLLNGIQLKSVQLASGTNVINHKLGRKLQGYLITRLRSSATIFDTQDANSTPQLTLQLTSSASALVDIYVF